MARFCDRKRCLSGLLLAMVSTFLLLMTASPARSRPLTPGDTEYFGKLDAELIPYKEDLDDVVFKPARDLAKIKFATPLPEGVTRVSFTRRRTSRRSSPCWSSRTTMATPFSTQTWTRTT
jgi:hypothetical protein